MSCGLSGDNDPGIGMSRGRSLGNKELVQRPKGKNETIAAGTSEKGRK